MGQREMWQGLRQATVNQRRHWWAEWSSRCLQEEETSSSPGNRNCRKGDGKPSWWTMVSRELGVKTGEGSRPGRSRVRLEACGRETTQAVAGHSSA